MNAAFVGFVAAYLGVQVGAILYHLVRERRARRRVLP